MTAHTKDQLIAAGFLGVGLYILLVGSLKGFQVSHGMRIPYWLILAAGLTALGLSWIWWPKYENHRHKV